MARDAQGIVRESGPFSKIIAVGPGLYTGIECGDYHEGPGVSVSMLKTLAEAPAKLKYGESKESRSLEDGTLIHTAVLEPTALEDRYAVTDLDRRGTKAWDAAEAAAGRKTLIKRPQWEMASRIRDSAQRHPVARELTTPSLIVEPSAYWFDEATGLLCRARPDGLRPDMRVIVDLKSTVDASPGGFPRQCAQYRYHWQNAHYLDGIAAVAWQPEAFIFIAVEKEPPYLVGAYELDPSDIETGRASVRKQLEIYAECQRTGVWPGYSDTLELISLPPWSKS